jgi:carboxyl-terminal processing protease
LPSSFEVTPEIVDEFKVFLSSRQIQPGIGEWSNEGVWVRNRLKEEIVTQGRGVAEGDEIEAENDPQVQAALKAMRELHLSAVSDQRSAN